MDYFRTVGFQRDRSQLFGLLEKLTAAVDRLADAIEASHRAAIEADERAMAEAEANVHKVFDREGPKQ